ncbi:winged helix-turn-helix domain-containing protein [Haloarchaeobius baliensis]|uniref:winged helix-turn-helix domain-containing protein n=1 Tax=Haloarchaeobius baliensis TaxID=1670458 RepID=UPI003F88167B
MSDSDIVVERLPPDEAFGLVAHETRVRVLEALLDAGEPLSFSELNDRVGMRDTGQFNYHLGKLTDRFVEQDDDDRYALTLEGARVGGAILSGGYTKGIDADPVQMDAPCLGCGSAMEATFEGTQILITCPDCGEDFATAQVPPGALYDCTPAEAVDVAHRWAMQMHQTAEFGFCTRCNGRMDRLVIDAAADGAPDWLADGRFEAFVHYECERCGSSWFTDVGLALMSHPAVISFHYDHGIDTRETRLWELDWVSAEASTVADRNPLRVAISVTLDGETLELTVDDELTVLDEARTSA